MREMGSLYKILAQSAPDCRAIFQLYMGKHTYTYLPSVQFHFICLFLSVSKFELAWVHAACMHTCVCRERIFCGMF